MPLIEFKYENTKPFIYVLFCHFLHLKALYQFGYQTGVTTSKHFIPVICHMFQSLKCFSSKDLYRKISTTKALLFTAIPNRHLIFWQEVVQPKLHCSTQNDFKLSLNYQKAHSGTISFGSMHQISATK